jgi:hypothetical protein
VAENNGSDGIARLRRVHIRNYKSNATGIAPLAGTSRRAVREKLFTTGELLRAGEIEGDVIVAERAANQLGLFGPVETPLAAG